ncbi:hypothetical protein IGI04_025245, partial [Brassica rapa subsp. trilocularis]
VNALSLSLSLPRDDETPLIKYIRFVGSEDSGLFFGVWRASLTIISFHQHKHSRRRPPPRQRKMTYIDSDLDRKEEKAKDKEGRKNDSLP